MKSRDSNFELLRLVAMMLVMLVHANYHSLGAVTQSEIIESPWSSFVRVTLEQLCVVSVNLFVLISGWFGIRPTLKKFSSFIFQVLFIGLISVQICIMADVDVPKKALSDLLYFGASYWFVPAYMILYWIAPVLNSFSERASKREFAPVLISFFTLQTIYGWITEDYGHYAKGYSAVSFMGLYLLAQFIRHHGNRLLSIKWWQSLLIYIIATAIPVVISYLGILYKDKTLGAISYTSLFVITASVALVLMFNTFHFKSRVINWLASSAFAIYLVHQAPGVTDLYINFFKEAYASMSGWLFIPFAIFATTLLGIASILIDKVRVAVWEMVLKVKSLLVR